jgi:hypothetical protein
VIVSPCKKPSRERIDAKKAASNRCRFTAAFQRLSKSPPTYPYSPLRKVRLYLERWGVAAI